MLGLILFILLLPVTLMFLAKIVLEEDNTILVFLQFWVYRNLYHLGIMLGALGRLVIPGSVPDTDDSSEEPSLENEVVRGIKKVWKL